MAPVLVWLILILCLVVSTIKYTLALILKWSVPGAKIRKRLLVPADGECPDALLQRGQDGVRDDREHQQERLSERPIRGDRAGRLLRGRQLRMDAQGAT